MGDKPVLFDAYLQEDLAQQSDEYKKEFYKEVYMLKIACKVMNFRKELGLTQREFAQKLEWLNQLQLILKMGM